MTYERTGSGFRWPAGEVVLVASDPKHGTWLHIRGKREVMEVRITPGGRLRYHGVKAR